jgi:hypothetical protein
MADIDPRARLLAAAASSFRRSAVTAHDDSPEHRTAVYINRGEYILKINA